MTEEAPPGSVGIVFYTISDTKDERKIEFNIHAFGLIATSPQAQWSESEAEQTEKEGEDDVGMKGVETEAGAEGTGTEDGAEGVGMEDIAEITA